MSDQDYRLYIDETGTDAPPVSDHPNHRFLSLTGIVMSRREMDHAAARLSDLKQTVFGKPHPDDRPVVIHWSSIPTRKGPFECLRDEVNARRFSELWTAFLKDTDFTAFTVSIDKASMSRKTHWFVRHPYHYAMEILLERYILFLKRRGACGDVMPEERRGRKDHDLQAAFDEVRVSGTRFLSNESVSDHLSSTKLKFRSKFDNVAGLQIADCVSSIGATLVRPETRSMNELENAVSAVLLETKYARHPRTGKLWGTGLKRVP